MKTRIITGLSIAAVVLAIVTSAPVSVLMGVVALVTALCYLEFDRLFFSEKSLVRQGGMLLLIFLTVFSLESDLTLALMFLFLGFAAISISILMNLQDESSLARGVRNISILVLGLLYVTSLTGFLLPILEISEDGRKWLLLLFFMVFLGDTAAYFVGSRFGKKRLAPSISPKKSVEGAFASVGMSLIIALIWNLFFLEGGFSDPISWKLLLFTPVLSFLAQIGDLFESLLKRSASVKDSGHFLPGHGGILDRIDCLCFATPAFYVFLKMCWVNG